MSPEPLPNTKGHPCGWIKNIPRASSRRDVWESLSPAGSVKVGSDCHWQSFTTDPFDSLTDTKRKKDHAERGLLRLVEVRGIEPLSENLLIQLSPGAEHLLSLFLRRADAQARGRSNRFLRDRFNGNCRCTCTTKMTLSLGSWSYREERATRRSRHCHC